MCGPKPNQASQRKGAWHQRGGVLWLFSWVALGALALSVPTMRAKQPSHGPQPGAKALASVEKSLAQRTKSIEEIVPGDLVMAEDEATGKLVPKRVVQVFRNRTDHLRIVTIRSADGTREQQLKTTNEHPFYVAGEGWIAANRLTPGQRLVQSDKSLATVVSSVFEPHAEGLPVFNFEVEDVHNYFVAQDLGSLPVLVHNACQPRNAPGKSPSWTKTRGDYWKGRAGEAMEGEFSPQNLERMRQGKAPLHDEVGVPKELHHNVPRREGGTHTPDNLREVWPWEHEQIDPFRHYNGPRPSGG